MVGMAYINSVWSFYVVFMVASLGVSGASHGVSWSVAVANWFNRLRGRALGIAMLGPVVGGPFVVSVAVLEGWLGWRVSMLLLGVGVWIVGIPLSLLARSFQRSTATSRTATHAEALTTTMKKMTTLWA